MTNALTSAYACEAPSEKEVRQQSTRINASTDFLISQRGRRLFEFLVEETLAGRGASLKAFSIAQDVFGRDASFDAQNDPCVRIAAGQIRNALERYYLTAGSQDDLIIAIPKGQYRAEFESRRAVLVQTASEIKCETPLGVAFPPAASPEMAGKFRWMIGTTATVLVASTILTLAIERAQQSERGVVATVGVRPSIVIEQSGVAGNANSFSVGFSDEVITALSDKILVIVDRNEPNSVAPIFSMQSGIQTEGSDLRVNVRIVRRADGTVVWAGGYRANLKTEKILDVQAKIAHSLALAVVQSLEFGDTTAEP